MLNRSDALTNKATKSLVAGKMFSAKKNEGKLRNVKSEMIFDDVIFPSRELIINEEIAISSNEFTSKTKEVRVVITKDQHLLDQYYELREDLFREVDQRYKIKHPEDKNAVIDYDGSETDADRFGEIIVVLNSDNRVVGGMRFLLSNSIEHSLNQVPESGFTIKEFLKKSSLNSEAKFSEASAVVIRKCYRNREVMKSMFAELFRKSIELGCDYVIGIAIDAACRDHKIATRSLGYKLEIVKQYPWIKQREHGYEQRYPVVVHLKESSGWCDL